MELKFCPLTIFLVLLLGTPHPGFVKGANVTDVRFGGNKGVRSGVLEIQVDGKTWGVVCDDGWSEKPNVANVIVACRSLGFENGGKAVLDGQYGDGIGDFLMDDAACSNDMKSLAQCQSSQGNDCTRKTDKAVALECNENSGPDVTTFKPPSTTKQSSGVISDNCQSSQSRTVQLIGNTDKDGIKGTGYVKVKNPNTNQWGFVCDDGWDAMAAKVVCAQLCFPTNYTAKPGIPAELKVDIGANPTIILDDVKCKGNEAKLEDCPSNNFADSNDCSISRGEIAGVQCVEANFEAPNPPDPVLECGNGVIKAKFYRSRDSNLDAKHLSVLNDPNCANVQKETTTDFVSIIIPVDKCGTNVSRNATHILYNNDIKYASTFDEGFITRFNTYRVEVECALPVDKIVTQRVEAVTQAVTKKADGVIKAGMSIYRSDSFNQPVTENPVRIPLGEYLNLAINMENFDPRLKLVVEDCVATPTGDTSNTRLTKELFKDKCIEEKTLSTYPISNFEFGFRFKPFKFVNYPLLYIQCDSIICLAADVTSECDRTCNNTKPASSSSSSNGKRRKRSLTVQRKKITSPAIFLYDPHQPDPDSGKDDIKIIIIETEDKNVVTSTLVTPPRLTPVTSQEQQQTTSQKNISAALKNTTPSPSMTSTSSSSSLLLETPPSTLNPFINSDDNDDNNVDNNDGKVNNLFTKGDNSSTNLLSFSSSGLLFFLLLLVFTVNEAF